MQRLEEKMKQEVDVVERDFQEIVESKEDRLRQMESKVKKYKRKVEEQGFQLEAET